MTGAIAPERVGEVMVAVRGGSESFHAYAADNVTLPKGARVVVVEYYPPRTVIVAEA